MSNFVFDSLPVPETKTNLNPVQGLSINNLSATEFNLVTQYLSDISTALKLGKYHGLTTNPTEGVSLTGQLKVRYNATSSELECSREGQTWATVDGVVDVRRFGVLRVEDGVTDCSAALVLLQAYLRSVQNKIVYFPPGTYTFQNCYFFANMPGGHVFKMYGVKWGSTWYFHGGGGSVGDGANGVDGNAISQPDFFVDWPSAPTSWAQIADTTPYYLNCLFYPFLTTLPQGVNFPANTFSLTMTLASDSAAFQAGDKVFLCGYCIQTRSNPSSTRYYEYAIVKSVNAGTGVITFEQALKNTYNQNWINADASQNLKQQAIWAATHAYTVGQIIAVSSTPGAHLYQCATPGTSSSVAPSDVSGAPVTDGTVVWTYIGDDVQYYLEPYPGSNWLASWYPQYARYGSVPHLYPSNSGFCGAPMIINISRRMPGRTSLGFHGVQPARTYGFVQSDFRIEGLTTIDNPHEISNDGTVGFPGNRTQGYGSVQFGGCKRLELVDCKFGSVTVGGSEYIRFKNCSWYYFEPDKNSDTLILEDCKFARLAAATGMRNLFVKGGECRENLNVAAPHLTIDGLDIYANTYPGSGGARAVIGGETVVLKNCKFYRPDGDTNALLSSNPNPTFTVLSSPAPTASKVYVTLVDGWGYIPSGKFDSQPQSDLWKGMEIVNVGATPFDGSLSHPTFANRGIVSDIATDVNCTGLIVAISANFLTPPVGGDVFTYKSMRHFSMDESNVDVDMHLLTRIPGTQAANALSIASQSYHLPISKRIKEEVFEFPLSYLNSVSNFILIDGYVLSVEVDVRVAAVMSGGYGCYVGFTNVYRSGGYLVSSPLQFLVDATIGGLRYADATGRYYYALGSNTNAALPTVWEQNNFNFPRNGYVFSIIPDLSGNGANLTGHFVTMPQGTMRIKWVAR